VRAWLADAPVNLHSSFNGSDGLGQAAAIRPDLILLDVNLPGLDGFEVCKRLRSNPLTADVPIVFLTGASSTEEKLRGLELGATDYITKPFDPAELLARVRSALMTRHLMDLLAQKALILQESEERFRLLAENSSDAITRHTPDGIYLYASPSSATILGYTPEELMGRKVAEFIHSDDIPAVTECFAQARIFGGICTIAFRFKRRDGQLVWLESTCRILTDPSTGMVSEIHASSRDISNRKQMENREAVRADVLEMIAQSEPLNVILRKLIDAAERQEPQAIGAGVMLSDSFLHHSRSKDRCTILFPDLLFWPLKATTVSSSPIF
jgi:PAS domain S-box-containing protein